MSEGFSRKTLKALLAERGISTKGSKADLEARYESIIQSEKERREVEKKQISDKNKNQPILLKGFTLNKKGNSRKSTLSNVYKSAVPDDFFMNLGKKKPQKTMKKRLGEKNNDEDLLADNLSSVKKHASSFFAKKRKVFKLFVSNVEYSTKKHELQTLFKEYGVIDISIPKTGKRGKGYVFVTLEKEEQLKNAIKEMNGEEFKGRELTVEEAKEGPKFKKFRKKQNMIKKGVEKKLTELLMLDLKKKNKAKKKVNPQKKADNKIAGNSKRAVTESGTHSKRRKIQK